MIHIIDKTKCCGCTACVNVCPTQCIRMEEDLEGFLYPKVDESRCIHCDRCNQVCPVEKSASVQAFTRESYILRTKDRMILKDSTAGGFVTPLFEWVLDQGGLVCAAGHDDRFMVVHSIIDDREDIAGKHLRGSKYVQSRLDDSFSNIQNALREKRKVCFVGTPCQVNGLKTYLGNSYEELITVDLVCKGVTPGALWEKYLRFQESRQKTRITDVAFRNKTYGYYSSTMRLNFDNGKVYLKSARVDPFLKSFYSNIIMRPICYVCPFKTVERCSDFTIYDGWSLDKLAPGVKNDNWGYTNMIIQTEKGKELFNRLKSQYESYSVDTEAAIKLNGIMANSATKMHKDRDIFFRDVYSNDLQKHTQRFLPITIKDHILEHVKGITYRTGLLKTVKQLRRKIMKF